MRVALPGASSKIIQCLSRALALFVIALMAPLASGARKPASGFAATAPVAISPEQVRVLEGHQGSVEGEDFSADGKTLISASRDRTLKVWNLQTGELLRTIDAHDKDVMTVRFS